MTLEIVPMEDRRTGVHIEASRTFDVPFTEEQRQLGDRPARRRVECNDCGRQIDPRTAVKSDEGYICASHED